MRPVFVETENAKHFKQALSDMSQRGAEEACFVVVDGNPGLGKTTILTHWVAQSGSIYLRCKSDYSINWFMNELLKSLNAEPPHSYQKKFQLALRLLNKRQSDAGLGQHSFSLVIDECDHISGDKKTMESIRDLSDLLYLPVILIGMGKLRTGLTRLPQIASRVSRYVAFNPVDEKDARALVDGLCEIPVQDDLVRFLLKATGGYTREIKEAIMNIERFGRRQSDLSDRGISLADMSGQVLFNDRSTSQPIYVPDVF